MIQQLGWLDVFEVAGSLRTRAGLFGGADEHGRRVLRIRGPGKGDGEFAYYKTAGVRSGKWPEMAALLDDVARLGNGVGGVTLGPIAALWIDAGAPPVWEPPTVSDFSFAVLPLRTNPASIIYSGPVAAHIPAGNLSLVERRLPWCIVNHGSVPVVYLLIDFRRRGDA